VTRESDVVRPKRRRWPWLAGWLFLSVGLAWLARGVAWGELLDVLAGADPLWLGAAVVANLAILPFLAWQWDLFLPLGNRVGFARMLRIQCIVGAISNTGPFIAGHAAGIHLVATEGRVGHPAAVSAKALDQLSEGVSKLAMLAVVVVWVPLPGPLRAAALGLLCGVPALFSALLFVAYRAHALERWAARWDGAAGRVASFTAQVAREMETLRRPCALAGALGIGILQKLAEGTAIWLVLLSLGLDVPGWTVPLSLTAVSLATMVSVTPAQLGLYEGSAYVAFSLAGLGTEEALGAAVLQHLAYLAPFVGSGWITLALDALLRHPDGAQGSSTSSIASPSGPSTSAARPSPSA